MINVLLYALNIIDLACTLMALRIGATELNPLMASVPVMVVYKLVVVGVLCWWLYHRRERIARWALSLCTVVYVLTNINHIVNLVVIGVIF